jgi:hypothetical protein
LSPPKNALVKNHHAGKITVSASGRASNAARSASAWTVTTVTRAIGTILLLSSGWKWRVGLRLALLLDLHTLITTPNHAKIVNHFIFISIFDYLFVTVDDSSFLTVNSVV